MSTHAVNVCACYVCRGAHMRWLLLWRNLTFSGLGIWLALLYNINLWDGSYLWDGPSLVAPPPLAAGVGIVSFLQARTCYYFYVHAITHMLSLRTCYHYVHVIFTYMLLFFCRRAHVILKAHVWISVQAQCILKYNEICMWFCYRWSVSLSTLKYMCEYISRKM